MRRFFQSIKVKDLIIPVLGALLAAHIIVMFGVDTSFARAIRSPGYHIALWCSMIIALVLIFTVWQVTWRLHLRYRWQTAPRTRLGLQVLFGFLLPALVAPLLAAAYFYGIYRINIFNTLYFRFDYLPILLMLILPNIYFSFFYAFKKQRNLTGRFEPGHTDPGFSIGQHEIAYIFHNGNGCYLCMNDGRRIPLNASLHQCIEQLDESLFFKVNRWMILHKEAIRQTRPGTSNRIELVLTPEHSEPVFVSQNYKPAFAKWYGNGITGIR